MTDRDIVKQMAGTTEPAEPKRKMTAYDATMIAEGVDEADEETQIEAWQYLHDTGIGYQLQGWFGRRLRDLIEQGVING